MGGNRPGRKFPDEFKRDAGRSSTPQATDLQDIPSGAPHVLVLPGLGYCVVTLREGFSVLVCLRLGHCHETRKREPYRVCRRVF